MRPCRDLQLKPPMFNLRMHDIPPPCAGIIGFRRVQVRMFFVNAAARLINQTNMADSTQASLGVLRQTDQEMMWFELMHGPPAKQPYLLEPPEESTIARRHLGSTTP